MGDFECGYVNKILRGKVGMKSPGGQSTFLSPLILENYMER